jgi:hypothetical protein
MASKFNKSDAHAAGPLQAPGKTSGRHSTSDEGDGPETPQVLTSNRSFALGTAKERQGRQSRTGVEKGGGRQRPGIDSRSLNEGGRNPEKDGGHDGQDRGFGDGINLLPNAHASATRYRLALRRRKRHSGSRRRAIPWSRTPPRFTETLLTTESRRRGMVWWVRDDVG